ncbi:B12-binding domain-containing radical SAM protein [Sporomusa sphaeroides]|uniref:B12-binding domain-containing radical SAM protein n=1 Tax=Sporomusa sphaeroides TaxID=47679 RepID=UPI002B7DC70D|nr:radical SAM protein [Sporomusa sphaeroides]HML33202.1 radical SAM protein [Sporomusa sphaeroides]
MKKNILLIYPPIDKDYYIEGVNDSPPLGLVALQNYICRKSQLPVKVDIIDGEYSNLEKILSVIRTSNYELIGIQPMMASYRSTLRILEEAKKFKIMTAIGGHHATNLAQQIIKKRNLLIDFIILGDGEVALTGLIKEESPYTLPNLMFYDKSAEKIICTNLQNVPLEDGKIDFIDEQVLNQYKNTNNKKLERGQELISFRLYSHKGCSNRLNSQYCYFCGRADKGVRFKTPQDYIDELLYLSNMPNAEYIFEIGDDFLQDMDWLNKVCDLKEKTIKDDSIKLKIFARANRITPSVIPILKRLNIDEVAIGFESGSARILKNINKNATPSDNMEAAQLLFSHGIDTIASFVLGLPGEDTISLEETYNQAMELRELSFKYLGKGPQEIIANLIEINPGSPAFRQLQSHYPKYLHEDDIRVKQAQDDYFKMIFGLQTIEEVELLRNNFVQWGKKINKLGNYTYPAGWVKGEI